MKKKELKNKSISELKSDLKKIRKTSRIIFGVTLVLFAIAIYGVIINHEFAIFFAAIIIIASSILNIPSLFGSVHNIKTELKSRKHNNQSSKL